MQGVLVRQKGGHGPRRSMRREWKLGTRYDSLLYGVIALLTTKTVATRSYFSERNGVSFPERYSKSEKGRGFDILCMRSTALICSVVRTWGFSAR